MVTHGRTLFVTATGTDVGKTLVCGLLLRTLLQAGVRACYQKWVSTGDAARAADLDTVQELTGTTDTTLPLDLQVPYRFALPASPHLAAEQEGIKIDPTRLIDTTRELTSRYDFVIVEGAGGVMVPLTRDLLLADLLAELRPPTLIVAKSGLGTINHTLLTIEALKSRNIPILGLIFSDGPNPEDERLIPDNMATITALSKIKVFGRLSSSPDPSTLISTFAPIAQNLLDEIGLTLI
ncbi:MAG: dethiobiotin synthase [Proteobacteria bacterium]|nr:dethiobiotin synthase [Pseudomonadota bacterium]MBU1687509.1 dethiobiotin synthase [Pseudomonadota bacterium]